MTKEKLMDRLRVRTEKFDTQKEAAEHLGVSASYLNDVFKGKREPAGKLLISLGFERVISYREVK